MLQHKDTEGENMYRYVRQSQGTPKSKLLLKKLTWVAETETSFTLLRDTAPSCYLKVKCYIMLP